MTTRRKYPFSGKAKKQQLKDKKLKCQDKKLTGKNNSLPLLKSMYSDDESSGSQGTVKINQQPSTSSKVNTIRNTNRYALHFYKEDKTEIHTRKIAAQQSLEKVSQKDLELDWKDYFPPEIDLPKRPPWNFNTSKEELNAREHRYFTEFVKKIEKEFGCENLSYFELNLETWRQFWRVLEMSDIVLIIVDVRFAVLMFPPYVYKYVCEELNKDMILVLNKVDLVPPDVVIAWKYYFSQQFPTLKIVTFTSFPIYNLREVDGSKTGLKIRRRKCKPQMAAEGALKLFEACKDISRGQVDLSSWAAKITEELNTNDGEDTQLKINIEALDTSYHEHIKYHDGTLTIGCIGQPNVGKSSLMNAIIGKKVVSVSRTPGHTKHFQTIYLTKNVILCDCPGLVFPSKVQRIIQILNGSYPIAQVREPYTAVKYLAERLDLPQLLRIQHPENDDMWSAIDICDGWARKRGFFTAKTARPDTYRAANSILRIALEGRLGFCFKPPGYHANKEYWLNHPEVADIVWIQAKFKKEIDGIESEEDTSLESADEEKSCAITENESSDGNSSLPEISNRFVLLQDA